MPEDPEKFYSRGAEEFAHNNSIENISPKFIEILDRFCELVRGEKILDAGCGPGRDVEYFINNGFEAVGVDLAEGMVDYAKQNMEGEYHVMDVKDLGFEDRTFDGVWCNTVLIFFPLEEMREIVEELYRVTKDEAVMHFGLKVGEEQEFIRKKYGSEVKQYIITKEQARKLVEEAGFEIIEFYKAKTGEGYSFGNIICRKK